MQTRKLTLYNYWRSSCSYRVRLALAAKKLDYEYVAVNIAMGEQSEAKHMARSPSGYVPALVVDGDTFVESVAIIELLDDLFPETPLLPKDAVMRARMREMIEAINAGIQPLQNTNVLLKVSTDGPTQRAWAAHYNERGMRTLEAMLERNEKAGIRGRFAFGDSFSAADCLLLPQTYSARRFGVDLSKFSRVAAAEAAGLATDAAKLALPEAQPDAPAQPK